MKVFNLGCGHDHRFEGWFSSADDYEKQLGNGLLECPLCGDRSIQKLPSAPRLNLSGSQAPEVPAAAQGGADQRRTMGRPTGRAGAPADERRAAVAAAGSKADGAAAAPSVEQLQAMWLRLARQLVQNTEDVGESFADEARRIHYREAPERGIRGVASADEREALADEGIDVFSFPLPRGIEDPVQ